MEFLELRLFDLRFELTKRDAGDDIVLVAIDNGSLKELGVWPWPRAIHAQALDNLVAAAPRTIAYNVDFSSASLPAADSRFEDSLARAGRKTILPAFLQTEMHGNGGRSIVYTSPLPAFARHVTTASVNLFPAADGYVREMRGEIDWRDTAIPTLATLLAGGEAQFSSRFYIDYGIDSDSLSRIPFADVLHGRFDRAELVDKIVIVGATAAELADGFPTPQGPAVPGSVLHVLATESLLQDRTLWRTPPLVGLAGIVLAVFVFAPFCSRRPWQQGMFATAAVITTVFLVALGVQWLLPLLIDVVPWMISALVGFGLGMTRQLNIQNLRLLTQNITIGRKEAYVRGLLETAFDGVIAVDESGLIRSANQRAQEMFGLAEDQLIGHRFLDFLFADSHSHAEDFLQAAARQEEAAEVTARRDGGEKFIAKLAVTRVPGDDGHTLFVVLLLDVTALHMAQAEALDIRQRLANSLEAISEGIALWDANDRLLICNARFIEFHAAAAHILLPGCPFGDFVRDSIMLGPPPDAQGREREWIAERMERHRRPVGRFMQQTSEGRWLRTVERRTGNDEIICVETDVTDDQTRTLEIIAACDAAEAASRAKTRFLANVSHELRTPLNAILGFSELIRDGGMGSDSASRYAEYGADIHKCGSSLLKMIDDILELSRIDSGSDELHERRVQLHALIRECCETAEAELEGSDRRLDIRLPDEMPDIQVDRAKIEQCLVRLLRNAIVFTEAGDDIIVGAVVDDGGELRISVADSGCGMPADDTGRVLEPFGRVGDPLVGNKPGLGLGLTLANMAVRQHGGRLEIASETGRGTTATICIPAQRVLGGFAGGNTPARG